MTDSPTDASQDEAPDPAPESQHAASPGTPESPSAEASDDPADDASEDSEAVVGAADLVQGISQRRQIRQAGHASLGTAWFRGESRFTGPASLGGHAAGRDVNIFLGATERTAQDTGVISPRQLRHAESVHVSGASYPRTMLVLREERLVVLRGATGTGKRTTALAALSERGLAEVHAVSDQQALDSSSGPGFRERAGHFAESSSAPELTYARLAAVSDALTQLDSYLVLTVPASTAADTDTAVRFVVDHEPPLSDEVVLRHIRVEGGSQVSAAEQLPRRLLQLPYVDL